MRRLVRLLALRHLRRHPLRAALAAVGVAAGTALAVTVLVVQSSVATSVEDFGRALAGPTEFRVVGAVRRGGLDPSVVDAVAATDGVAAAIPLVQGVTIVDRPGTSDAGTADVADVADGDGDDEEPVVVLGIDCRVEALVGAFGCSDGLLSSLGAGGATADDAGAADTPVPLMLGPGVDRRGVLRTHVGPVPLAGAPTSDLVAASGLAAGDDLAALAGGDVVVFHLPDAQELFGRGDRLDVAYVRAEDGTDLATLRRDLDAAVGDRGAVLTASDGPPEIAVVLAGVLPMFTLLAVFALGTGGMLVFNTASLSVEERRRDLAVVGALGGTSSVVAVTTLVEAAVVGALGGALGAAGGLVVAGPIVASLSGYTQRVAGIPLAVHVGAGPMALGLVLGTVVSVLAAAVPFRRAVRADAAAELSGRGLRAEARPRRALRRSAAWGAVALAGLVAMWFGNRGGGLDPWQVPAGGLGFAATAIGTVLCGAGIAAVVVRPLGRLVRGLAAEHLAVANLVRDPARTGIMAAAVGAAVTTAFVTAGYANGVRVAIRDDVLPNLDGLSVAAVDAGANVNLDTGIDPEVIAGLEALPAVERVDRGASVLAGARARDTVAVVAYQDLWFTSEDDALRGSYDVDRFLSGEAILNSTIARDEGLRPGDRVSLPTPDGTVEVPVMAVASGGGANGRTVQVPWELHRELYGPQPARSVNVVPRPGVSNADLVDAIEAAGLDDTVTIRTPADVVAQASDNAEGQLAPFRTLQQGLLAVSFVAVLSTLLLVGVQRRQEFGLLGALGMEPATLARMVVAEAAAVALVAIALGVVGGLVLLEAITLVGPLLIGYATPFAPSWPPYASAALIALTVTVLASLWPATRAARTDPIAALRDE